MNECYCSKFVIVAIIFVKFREKIICVAGWKIARFKKEKAGSIDLELRKSRGAVVLHSRTRFVSPLKIVDEPWGRVAKRKSQNGLCGFGRKL